MQASKSISRCHPVLGQTKPFTFFFSFFQAPGLLGVHSKLPVALPAVTLGLWIDAGVCSARSAGHWHVWPMSARPRRKAPNCRHYTGSPSKLPWKQGRALPTLLSVVSALEKFHQPLFVSRSKSYHSVPKCQAPAVVLSKRGRVCSHPWPLTFSRGRISIPLTASSPRHVVSVTVPNGKVCGSVRLFNKRRRLFCGRMRRLPCLYFCSIYLFVF